MNHIYKLKFIGILFLLIFNVGLFKLLTKIWHYHVYYDGIQQKLIYKKDQYFFIISLTFMHTIVYFSINFYYCLLYYLQIPYIESFKVEKVNLNYQNKYPIYPFVFVYQQKPWMWKSDPNKFWVLVKKTTINIILNMSIATALAFLRTLYGVPFRLDTQSLPNIFEICWQFIFSMIVEDFTFYISHRILHHNLFYKYFHKQHHEYNITGLYKISFSAEYAHPVEYIFGNVVPSLLGASILGKRVHLITLLMWLTFRIMKTLHGHSGYLLPWEPFDLISFGTTSDFHGFHHSNQLGNYGSAFIMWDNIFKTDQAYKMEIKQIIKQVLSERLISKQWKEMYE